MKEQRRVLASRGEPGGGEGGVQGGAGGGVGAEQVWDWVIQCAHIVCQRHTDGRQCF